LSLAAISNPFHSPVVSDPWEGPEIDVTSVHQSAFARCCEAVAAVRARPNSASVLVYGESGSGKTHLLARLRARVAGEGDGSGSFQKAIFVSAPLRASARMIWRHLRDCLVGDLLRRSGDGGAQLERLLLGLLSKHRLISGDGPLWLAQR
jgi:ABC-type phosphonate transport system ATPase subunit